jgi:hypothetical protein
MKKRLYGCEVYGEKRLIENEGYLMRISFFDPYQEERSGCRIVNDTGDFFKEKDLLPFHAHCK